MIVRSMRGQRVDMAQMMARHATKPALGNANLNARGDRIARNGAILATREQMMNEYNSRGSKTVQQVGLSGISTEVLHSPSEALAHVRKQHQAMGDKSPKRKISDTEI